ncbi:MAG: type VI secretion system tip protein VgrG [Alphaproteobacteria bacterium]|nr:type VI secretion system tip protein VgrG [Alphaproteobacteria bacterium]
MASITQTERFLSFKSPKGDSLMLTGVSGEESTSTLYEFTLDLLSSDDAIKPEDMIGKNCTVVIGKGDSARKINGICGHFGAQPQVQRGYRVYKALLVPEHWKLLHKTNNRIFQNKTVLDIVEQVLTDAGLPAPNKSGIGGTYNPIEYVCQFMETDFNFISRLMQGAGILYFFKHAEGSHTFCLADKDGNHEDIAEAEVEMRSAARGANTISSFVIQSKFLPGKLSHTDYDFKAPDKALLVSVNTDSSKVKTSGVGGFEVYEYPGGYTEKADGEKLAKQRMEAIEAGHQVATGQGTNRHFTAGGLFKLTRHDVESEKDKKWLITRVKHMAMDTTHLGGGGASYANDFSCVPEATIIRPERAAIKPVMPGPQTALVVGPSGEDIYTDEFGRIRIQFFWDREGTKNEQSTCWCRVAQMWAGAQWGTIFIPRIGMEVVVDFLNGDPDHPIVTGCVYNGNNMPPWALPDNKTQSGIRTRSTTKGSAKTENVLQFEDKKGKEFIYFHAEKDFKRHVENDDTLFVGNDQTEEIKNARKTEVKEADDTLIVHKGNRITNVKKGDFKTDVDFGSMLTNVKTDVKMTVKMGNHDTKVSMGNMKTEVSLGKMDGEAMQSIEFKVGASSIKIDQMGVTIKGMMVKVEGTIMVDVKALMTSVKGDAMTTIKGGIVLIN